MTTVLKISIDDLTPQTIRDLRKKFEKTAQIEIRVDDLASGGAWLSEAQFWQIVDALDWSKTEREEILMPAALALSRLPMAAIYLFKDKLSEKLHRLDTRRHAQAHLKKLNEAVLSADDFLFARCAVVAEGRDFYEKVLKNPAEMPGEIDFEHMIGLADRAYQLKTGKKMDYLSRFNYETGTNLEAWK